jgi:hypothetical protein
MFNANTAKSYSLDRLSDGSLAELRRSFLIRLMRTAMPESRALLLESYRVRLQLWF